MIHAPATYYGMVLSGIAVTATAFVEFFATRREFTASWYSIGLAIGLSAFALRAWSARALGDLWSTHVEVRREHRLVTSGPYRWVRHPIYVAAFLELIGAMLILQAPYALIPFVGLFIPVITWRIRIEERVMAKQLPNEYESYMNHVPALVPQPWRRMP